MMVIAILTKDEVPQQENVRVIDLELYTLALEQRLLHYYKITGNDARFDNDTFTSGGADKKGSAGYALYVAFSLEENEDNDEQNEFREEEESILPDEYPPSHEPTETSLVRSETNPQQVDLNTTAMLVSVGCSLEEEQSRQYTSPSQYYDETISRSPQTINQSLQHETIFHGRTYPTEIHTPSQAEIHSPSRAEIQNVPGNDGSGQSHSRNDNISPRFAMYKQINSEMETLMLSLQECMSHSLTDRNSTKRTQCNNGSTRVRKN